MATRNRHVRVGTIVWGVFLLLLAALAFCVAVFDLREFQAATVTWVVTSLGGIFVLVAIVALIARAVTGRGDVPGPAAAPAAAPEPEPTPEPASSAPAAARPATRKKKDQPVD